MIGGLVRFSQARPRRTLTYTPRWRTVRRIPRAVRASLPPLAAFADAMNNEGMLFDRRAALPVATIIIEQGRSRSWLATAASWSRGIQARAWQFLKPRLVPLAVALTGMFAVLGSAEYLTRLARHTPEQSTPVVQPEQLATLRPDTMVAPESTDVSNQGVTVISTDGDLSPLGLMQLQSGEAMPIRLVPSR